MVEGVSTGVTVTMSVVVVVVMAGGVKVTVIKVRVLVEEDVVTDVAVMESVISIVVAGMVTAPLVADVVVVEDATKPRTLDAVALSVHSTTTPVVEFIGMAKHSEPLVHTLTTKFPAWLQVPILPERQAILPGVHGEEKLSVEKKAL